MRVPGFKDEIDGAMISDVEDMTVLWQQRVQHMFTEPNGEERKSFLGKMEEYRANVIFDQEARIAVLPNTSQSTW